MAAHITEGLWESSSSVLSVAPVQKAELSAPPVLKYPQNHTYLVGQVCSMKPLSRLGFEEHSLGPGTPGRC